MKFNALFGRLFIVFLFTTTLLLLPSANGASIPSLSNLTSHPGPRLEKRGCASSKQTADGSDDSDRPPEIEICSTLSVDYFKALIEERNTLPHRDCLFYLGLRGGMGMELARQWYCQHRGHGRGAVVFGNSIPDRVSSKMFSQFLGKDGPSIADPSQQMKLPDIASRLQSQAMGEMCNGDVYFFAPNENDGNYPDDNVWRLFEYPALTRNDQVRQIFKVDPTNPERAEDPIVMWTPQSGPSAISPQADGYEYEWK